LSKDVHTTYKYAPLEEGAFFFPTDEGCYYTIEILEAGYKLWSSHRLSNDDKVFEISFDNSCDGDDPGYDEAISNTIIKIIGSNMASKGDTCVYYHICEAERGKARDKLYSRWFKEIAKYVPEYIMFPIEVVDDEENDMYYTSLFIHRDHPDMTLIVTEFLKAIEGYGS
jgi:hypothetical protein